LWGTGYGVYGTGYGVPGTGYRIEGLGRRVLNKRVQGFGLTIHDVRMYGVVYHSNPPRPPAARSKVSVLLLPVIMEPKTLYPVHLNLIVKPGQETLGSTR